MAAVLSGLIGPPALGHARVEQTMQYARFHPDYGDVRKYFESVESSLGLAESGNSLGNTPKHVTDPAKPPVP
jgi:hypothetical protein